MSVVAALYVALRGTTAIQALFYGIGPAVIALILRGAWKLTRVSMKDDRRLWAIFAAVALITFLVRSEVALLFIVAGIVGVVLFAPPGWLLPPLLMVVLFAPWIIRFREHPAVVGFTRGATAAAAGAIVGAAAVIATQVLVDVPTLVIFAAVLVVVWSTKLPEPLLVAAAAAVGLVAFAMARTT